MLIPSQLIYTFKKLQQSLKEKKIIYISFLEKKNIRTAKNILDL